MRDEPGRRGQRILHAESLGVGLRRGVRKRAEVRHDIADAPHAFADVLERVQDRGVVRHFLLGHLQGHEREIQRVVDLVQQPGRQLAQSVHLLALHQLDFRLLQFLERGGQLGVLGVQLIAQAEFPEAPLRRVMARRQCEHGGHSQEIDVVDEAADARPASRTCEWAEEAETTYSSRRTPGRSRPPRSRRNDPRLGQRVRDEQDDAHHHDVQPGIIRREDALGGVDHPADGDRGNERRCVAQQVGVTPAPAEVNSSQKAGQQHRVADQPRRRTAARATPDRRSSPARCTPAPAPAPAPSRLSPTERASFVGPARGRRPASMQVVRNMKIDNVAMYSRRRRRK